MSIALPADALPPELSRHQPLLPLGGAVVVPEVIWPALGPAVSPLTGCPAAADARGAPSPPASSETAASASTERVRMVARGARASGIGMIRSPARRIICGHYPTKPPQRTGASGSRDRRPRYQGTWRS